MAKADFSLSSEQMEFIQGFEPCIQASAFATLAEKWRVAKEQSEAASAAASQAATERKEQEAKLFKKRKAFIDLFPGQQSFVGSGKGRRLRSLAVWPAKAILAISESGEGGLPTNWVVKEALPINWSGEKVLPSNWVVEAQLLGLRAWQDQSHICGIGLATLVMIEMPYPE